MQQRARENFSFSTACSDLWDAHTRHSRAARAPSNSGLERRPSLTRVVLARFFLPAGATERDQRAE